MTYFYNGISITRGMTIKELLAQFHESSMPSVYMKNRYGKRATTDSDFNLIVDIDKAITIDPNPYCRSVLITCHVLEHDQNTK